MFDDFCSPAYLNRGGCSPSGCVNVVGGMTNLKELSQDPNLSDRSLKVNPGQGHPVALRLANGTEMHGKSFGALKNISGEFVFQTGMTGYVESLTDPSYLGQILVLTYPLIGNYGVPNTLARELTGILKHAQSSKIQVKALVVQNYTDEWSHHQSVKSLHEWLVENDIPGIYGVDTRELTKIIRTEGAMAGKVGSLAGLDSMPDYDYAKEAQNLVAEAAKASDLPKIFDKYQQGWLPPVPGGPKILMVDVGMKHAIVKRFLDKGCNVKVVPFDHPFGSDESIAEADGIFLSNGPGDPSALTNTTAAQLRKCFAHNKPIWGICLGNQLMSIACGAKTSKMKYGHRGVNQPCINTITRQVVITSQNHGFQIDLDSIPAGWGPLYVNANDGSCEGIICKEFPFFSVQFHPEAAAGPLDSDPLFSHYLMIVRQQKKYLEDNGGNAANPKWFFQKNNEDWIGDFSKFKFGVDENTLDIEKASPTAAIEKVPEGPPPLPKKVLVLGSGGLQIGQAGEFDYSGSQAIKALKEEGVKTVLINPNIATVQTAEGLADAVYFHPVNLDFVTSIIEKERPDGLMLQFGGQTALNTGLQLAEAGVLEKYECTVMGTSVASINTTEDRDLFAIACREVGEPICESVACTSVKACLEAADQLSYPVIIRVAFTLGGLGSGFAKNPTELGALADKAFSYAGQALVEKSVKGWREVEYEVVRDLYDNCVTVCNMENFDPMGIHTGDSIVIAPSQTLTDFEYNLLRNASINIVRKLKIQGECNVQFGLDKSSSRYVIIECNPRLSRSSALASKATGYPLAFVAAKLALGYPLDKIQNSVTRVTPASFEPSLDYCVTKFPRWDFSKFKGEGISGRLGSAMQSVGEVMSIGRSWEETFQKAIRMVTDFKCQGFMPGDFGGSDANIEEHLEHATNKRVWALARALELGYSVRKLHEITSIDPFWLEKLATIQRMTEYLGLLSSIKTIDSDTMRHLKVLGFSDMGIAQAVGGASELEVRSMRKAMGITPVAKQIDTLAAEFPAQTNYLYMTYSGSHHDLKFEKGAADSTDAVILGSGCYRIGSSVEFDYSCVGVARTMRAEGQKVAMINFNPETVSTDFDESDRLYFEELSLERVLDICDNEQPNKGVVISVGGQLPNDLCMDLYNSEYKVLGTCPTSIDSAEDRSKFSALCDANGIMQPKWQALTSLEDVKKFVGEVGFPILARPSYVLSGGGMQVLVDDESLSKYLEHDAVVSAAYPVVASKFYEGCFEADLDAIAQNGKVLCYGIADHVELAGTHSGDAHMVLPPHKISAAAQKKIFECGEKLAKALNISGPFNSQFICTPEDDVLVIECNVRGSRSLPFMSKTLRLDMVDIMGKVLMGKDMSHIKPTDSSHINYVGVKVPQFSWTRLKGADPRCGVEMASTGEVATFGPTVEEAFLKSLSSTHMKMPKKTILLSARQAEHVDAMTELGKKCVDMGLYVIATPDLAASLEKKGIPHLSAQYRDAVGLLEKKKADYLLSIPSGKTADREFESDEHYRLRRAAVDYSIPVTTELENARMLVRSLEVMKRDNPDENRFTELSKFNLDAYGELSTN